jgi:hypothetical protein
MRYFLLIIGLSSYFICQSQQRLTGIVYDNLGKPLAGAILTDNNHKFLGNTNDSGRFTILIKPESGLCFILMGFYDTCITVQAIKNNFEIMMKEKVLVSNEIIIKSNNSEDYLKGAQTGVFQIKPDSLRGLPNIVGEADPMRMLQLSPGVAKSEINMGINVRGSSTDQNLIFFDDAIIYNPTHLMGFLSIFNSAIIDNVTLIKAGLPAYYGGRLSSVTIIESNKTIPETPQFSANIGLLLSGFMYKVPLVKNKLSIMVAARKSYIDYTVKPVSKLLFRKSHSMFNFTNYGFYDLNFGLVYKPSSYDGIYISAYTGSDVFNLKKVSFDIQNNVDWSNYSISIKWLHNKNSFHVIKTVAGFSGNNFNFSIAQSNNGYWLSTNLKNYYFNHEHSFYLKKIVLKTGFNQELYSVIPSKNEADLSSQNGVLGTVNTYHVSISNLYIHTETNISSKLKIAIGLRGSYYIHFGPYTSYTRDYSGNINDTISYNKNETIKKYSSLEPRMSLNYTIDSISWLKLSATRNTQYLQQVNVTSVSLPTDFWLPATNFAPPAQGYQFSAGYFRKINNNFNCSFDVFYKGMSNILEFNSGILASLTKSTIEENVIVGKGRSYGMELFVEKTKGNLTGWLSYTLSRSERKFALIDYGAWYPAKYDHTHDLSLVLQYPLNQRWKAAAIFVYSTGNATTMPIGGYFIQGQIVDQMGKFNSSRLPSYNRMDVSFTRNIRKTGRSEQNLNISIYNVYNRQNPFFVYYNVTGDLNKYELNIKQKSVSVFPIMPSVSYGIRF